MSFNGKRFTDMVTPLLILAGGDGTRLQEVTGHISKPLVEIGGEPVISKIIRKLSSEFNLTSIYLLIQKKHYSQYYSFLEATKESIQCKIELVVEEKKLGTGGAIKNFLELSDTKSFFVSNADTLIKTNISQFKNAKVNSILCTIVKGNNRFGSVEINKNNQIVKFGNSNTTKDTLVNVGIYKLERTIFDSIPDTCFDIEKTIFPMCIDKRKLNCFQLPLNFEDIGVPEAYYREVKLSRKV